MKTSQEFLDLLNALATDLVNANIHFRLHRDLQDCIPDYADELNQTPTFWNLTFSAHLDAGMMRLCRVYDPNWTSLNLRTFLTTIRNKLHWFSVAEYRERLKGNAFIESLAASFEPPDLDQLRRDIADVSDTNPRVKTLIQWRHNAVAHSSPRFARNRTNFALEFPLTIDECRELAAHGMSIFNRYSNLFNANSFSPEMIGHDDYSFILKAIRAHLNEEEDKFQEELNRYGISLDD